MIKKKPLGEGNLYLIEIDGNKVGVPLSEEHCDIVLKWLNTSSIEYEVENEENT